MRPAVYFSSAEGREGEEEKGRREVIDLGKIENGLGRREIASESKEGGWSRSSSLDDSAGGWGIGGRDDSISDR